MATQHINPDTIHKPGAYSHVVVGAGTRVVSVAGQVAMDVQGNLVGKGDFAAQALQAYQNVAAALAAAGATFDDVTKMTVFIVGFDEATHFAPSSRPAPRSSPATSPPIPSSASRPSSAPTSSSRSRPWPSSTSPHQPERHR